jgi:hypothetical protein
LLISVEILELHTTEVYSSSDISEVKYNFERLSEKEKEAT